MDDPHDKSAAIRGGLPELHSAAFLLDLDYAGTLDSDEFRRRFAKLNARLIDQLLGFGCAVFFLPLPVVPLMVFLFTRDQDHLLASASIAMVAIPFAGVCLWFWSGSLRKFLRQRRLAAHGELVRGVLLVARRIMESQGDAEDGDIVVVEIEYRAVTSSGLRVTGRQTRPRDDLLNAELPEPGTPVHVLVLDEETHAIL